jgi:hypothetical protein
MNPPDLEQLQRYVLGPLVTQWFARFTAAEKVKDRFNTMAKLCRQFLGSSAKTMWEDSFRKEFYPQIGQPAFMVSLNKAFELVAIIGPSLYWQNPSREVRTADTPDQVRIAQMLGQIDEALLQKIDEQQKLTESQRQIRNSIATVVLEWIARQHPGGVKSDYELIIQDALVTGRGCGWTETYEDRASGEVQVGTFYDPVDNLLIDPDAKDPMWRDVRWIARRHVEPTWVVERRFGYPPGYLHGRGTHVSFEYAQKVTTADNQQLYLDQLEWYEVWSVGGIGARVTGMHSEIGQALDSLTGDYCYLCVSRNVAHPLNLPPLLVNNGGSQEILEALRWRTSRYGMINELWKKRQWPVEVLDFYPVINTCWPMAVLGPGIGSLLAMNLLLATHLEMSWDRRRDIVAIYNGYEQEIEAALKGENNPAIIKINPVSQVKVSDVVSFLQRPEIQGNLLEWIQYLDNQFQMATGLDDIHYGVSQKQSRVNADVQMKQSAANVRPDKMATDVHKFVVNVSKKEFWLAGQYMRGQQLQSLLGPFGSMAWDTLIGSMDFADMTKEMEIWVEATDLRRPNRDKDKADLEMIAPFLIPEASKYAQMTGDPKPLNAILARFGEVSQIRDIEDFFFGEFIQQPDPNVMAMQQQQAQIDAEFKQAQTEETKAKTIARLVDAEYKQQGASAPTAQKMRWSDIQNAQKQRQAEEAHLQKMVHLQEQFDIQAEAARQQAATKGKK